MVGLKKVLLPLSVVWLLATNDLIAADESIQSEMEQWIKAGVYQDKSNYII